MPRSVGAFRSDAGTVAVQRPDSANTQVGTARQPCKLRPACADPSSHRVTDQELCTPRASITAGAARSSTRRCSRHASSRNDVQAHPARLEQRQTESKTERRWLRPDGLGGARPTPGQRVPRWLPQAVGEAAAVVRTLPRRDRWRPPRHVPRIGLGSQSPIPYPRPCLNSVRRTGPAGYQRPHESAPQDRSDPSSGSERRPKSVRPTAPGRLSG
eukprot:scaffold201_cov405-Prasinococcus_capsulatus_cf.AAC.32